MFYGAFSTQFIIEEHKALYRLKNTIAWPGALHHTVNYRNFSGGFFLDPRLPYTVDDCLYIDSAQELLILITGCIYNRLDLCSTANIVPQTSSNPVLVAHLYQQQGPDFVKNLNGDFSLVIYEAHKNILYLFRDHVGIAPLAYTTTAKSIYFSYDIISLCRTFQAGNRITTDFLIADYKVVDLTLTPNENVLKLTPGHFLTYKEGVETLKKYWEPERIKIDKTLTQERIFAELKLLLTHAVHIRADQRFTAGSHLSGGFDSSMVAILARKEYQQQSPFHGYSWSPDNATPDKDELDERDLVKQTCTMAGIEPAFIHIEVKDFIEATKNSLNTFMYFYEEKVLELAHKHKTNLLFSGYGGDEFISYGSLGVDSDLFFNFQWKTFLTKNPLRNPKKIAKYLLFRILLPAINYVPRSVKKSYHTQLYFLKKEYWAMHQETFRRYFCYTSRRTYQVGILYDYHLPERTECWSVMGYKNGVVYRYPLLDTRIIEYMLKVPSKLLVKDSRYTRIILREISAGLLPEAVRWRIGKKDAAFFSLVDQQAKERALLFIDEINDFKANPDLNFIDFELLEQEVESFRKDKDYLSPHNLWGNIIAFKSLHEYTKSYRASWEDN